MRFFTSKGFLTTVGIVALLLAWLLISYAQGSGNLVFPSPIATFAKTGELLSSGYIWNSLGRSLLRTLIAFSISFLAALLLGSLAGEIKLLQTVFRPTITVLKSAPTAAFVFLFLLLYGSTRAPIGVVVLLAFPILYESVVSGYNAIDPFMIYAAKVDGGGKIATILRIKIPLASPHILLGVLNSFALSFKTEIMAEIITGSTSAGLGGAIRLYRNEDPSDLTPVFAITLIAIVTILFFDLISYLVKRYGLKIEK